MKYIDVHVHMGDCRVFGLNISEEQMLNAMDQNHINVSIVQPAPCPVDYKDVHERIYTLTKKYPGKIYGLVSINPHMPKEQFKEEVRHYVKDYGFLGIKLHTLGHAVSPTSNDAETIYEVAEELDIPVMVHTGAGVPVAMPALCIPPAKKHRNIKFIIAHAGGQLYSEEALILAQECDNVYLDLTWVGVEEAHSLVKQLGSKRMVYASDSQRNIPLEIKKYEMMDLSESELEDVFYKNAISIFKIKDFK